jgi:hypothetical protein
MQRRRSNIPHFPARSRAFPAWCGVADGGVTALTMAVTLGASAMLYGAPARAEEPTGTQQHSIALSGSSGLTIGAGGGNSYMTHTPAYVDVAWRTWSWTTPHLVTGFSLRSELDGRASVGIVPRFEFSRTVGRLTLRPGLAAVIYFAPYTFIGTEASMSFFVRVSPLVSVVASISIDGFFLGSDLPDRSAVVAVNGGLGVAFQL